MTELPHVAAGQPHVAAHNNERDLINAVNLALTFRLSKLSNLSDLDDVSESRDNLGLGDAATLSGNYGAQLVIIEPPGVYASLDTGWGIPI